MLKYFRALGIAGLTTLSAGQLALAGPDSVLWSKNKENGEVLVAEVKVAARARFRAPPGNDPCIPVCPP